MALCRVNRTPCVRLARQRVNEARERAFFRCTPGNSGDARSGAVLAADLGLPDIGLTTSTEIAARAQQTTRVTDLPVLIDADTGFGEPMNAARTVQLMEDAGLAGLHLEDQVNPKRCGHLDDKSVVPREEMARRIRAAVDARRDPDFLLMARTDTRAVEGLGAAIDRAKAYVDTARRPSKSRAGTATMRTPSTKTCCGSCFTGWPPSCHCRGCTAGRRRGPGRARRPGPSGASGSGRVQLSANRAGRCDQILQGGTGLRPTAGLQAAVGIDPQAFGGDGLQAGAQQIGRLHGARHAR
ncbi:isocitrate lyase/phosphoenolpyruvate mutase family protein [Streptantibioticus ferralitis]|uniref:Isocitrate lyase/phosphoenolpyruvate mutase family protein n=1 Tax=Streptantibioticus ferralitis TaxID=236510 RepID=A0ABT5YSX5_9ACTN|nr:isocitrate lyase/phosphoenolpyruvate mutase family protein [Streptantibioticus ferralitis]MDF2254711.1 isocitrate lyase/phosphoenolpyruvate mutase family protein [Streptantibioticus ferralitis]